MRVWGEKGDETGSDWGRDRCMKGVGGHRGLRVRVTVQKEQKSGDEGD